MASQGHSASRTILVVDDEVSVLATVKRILECDDYLVLTVDNTDAALRLIGCKELPIDLMITDVVMPDLNGRELAERALTVRPLIKVLFMSGYTDSELMRVKIAERASAFVPKPFTAAHLQEQVRKTLAAPLHRSAVAGADSFGFYRSITTERN